MPERLTGRELLTYLGQLHGLDADEVDQRADELLAVMELDGSAERTLVVDYSTGMRKKVGLATALLHAPRMLVLDEPFEAVDPVSAATIKQILRRFVDRGGSVLISSHVMALVEELCDTVGVMARGRVVVEGSLDDVRGGRSLEETFVDLVGVTIGGGEGLSWLAS
jgi:ABC-2 type transport system ATP-binding protein